MREEIFNRKSKNNLSKSHIFFISRFISFDNML